MATTFRRCLTGAAFAAPVLAAWLISAESAAAASLDVNPVRIDIGSAGRPAELRLTNTGSTPLSVQVDAVQWSQDRDGIDELAPTDQLLAVPPLFTVPPGARQIVRIGFLGEPSDERERSFRLLVTEIAASPKPADGSALAMRMRLSIPAFVAPVEGPAAPEIVLAGVASETAGHRLTLQNIGGAHARLQRIELLQRGQWLPLTETGLVRYLLPDAQVSLSIPPSFDNFRAVRISSIDGRDWEYAVQPSP